ncbi:hypothetical protein ACFTAO_12445 [Paenibacillus rhizoplanae]
MEKRITELEARIEAKAEPYLEMIEQIDSIPGIERTSAVTIFAEVGPHVAEMSRVMRSLHHGRGVSREQRKCWKAKKSQKNDAREQASERGLVAGGLGELSLIEPDRPILSTNT